MEHLGFASAVSHDDPISTNCFDSTHVEYERLVAPDAAAVPVYQVTDLKKIHVSLPRQDTR